MEHAAAEAVVDVPDRHHLRGQPLGATGRGEPLGRRQEELVADDDELGALARGTQVGRVRDDHAPGDERPIGPDRPQLVRRGEPRPRTPGDHELDGPGTRPDLQGPRAGRVPEEHRLLTRTLDADDRLGLGLHHHLTLGGQRVAPLVDHLDPVEEDHVDAIGLLAVGVEGQQVVALGKDASRQLRHELVGRLAVPDGLSEGPAVELDVDGVVRVGREL